MSAQCAVPGTSPSVCGTFSFLKMCSLISAHYIWYTLEGRGEKQAFKTLRLYSAIVAAVQRRTPTVTMESINNRVAAFLRGARDRDGGRKARMKGVDPSSL
ncbi:hypothetical protein V5799_024673 [Amblyomma americanum]|uniref:Uncharacterized protein n=1 Tax=Amblyomma americanum TaxID=6943 RepID=A0AAQ4EBV0_AMBAM